MVANLMVRRLAEGGAPIRKFNMEKLIANHCGFLKRPLPLDGKNYYYS